MSSYAVSIPSLCGSPATTVYQAEGCGTTEFVLCALSCSFDTISVSVSFQTLGLESNPSGCQRRLHGAIRKPATSSHSRSGAESVKGPLSNITRQVLTWNLQGKRKRERLGNRWLVKPVSNITRLTLIWNPLGGEQQRKTQEHIAHEAWQQHHQAGSDLKSTAKE